MNRIALAFLAAILLLLAADVATAADLSPFFDPQTMLPTDEVQRGMKGVVKTVYQGTTISQDEVEILGVVQKFNLGEDIILGKMLSGPVCEKKIGVISGMSGSPVYVNGKLIGALAFSWPFMTEPIFGITAINSMLRAWERQSGAEERPQVACADYGVQLAGRTVTHAEVSWNPAAPFVNEHTIALRPTAPLLFCSGFSADALKGLGQLFQPYGVTPLAGPGTMRDPVDVKLEPGSSVGVQLLWGDFDVTGVGTVTYTQGPRVLAFGHQMLKLGGIDFPLTTAWIHSILPSLEQPAKLGSAMARVGSLRQDTPWAVAGDVGPQAPSVPVEVRVTDDDSGLKYAYNFSVVEHESLTPTLVTMGLVSSLDAAYSAGAHGMIDSSFTIEGTKGAHVTRANTSYFEGSPMGEIVQGIMEVAALFKYNLWEPQDIKSVRVEATLRNRDDTAIIERVYSEQALAKAGEPLYVHVVIRPWGGQPVDRRLALNLPADLPATNLEIGVCGGSLGSSLRGHLDVLTPDYDSLQGMLDEFASQEKNTELLVLAAGPHEGMSVGATRLPGLPVSVQALLGATVPLYLSQGYEEFGAKQTEPWVIFGGAVLTVPVENRQGQRPIPPSGGGEESPAGSDEDSDGPREPPSPPERGMVWSTKPMGRTEFQLPEYPPRSLGWAASGLRADVVSRLRPRPMQPSPPGGPGAAKPESPVGAPPAASPRPREPREESQPEEEREFLNEAEREREEGVGLVLRQPTDFIHATADDFADGETRGTGLASEGGVLLVPTWKQVASLPERTLLAAACAPDGTLYFSADGGRIYRFKADKAELFYETKDFAVTALIVRPDGTVLAGCSTSGKILEITPQGQATELCRISSLYIWSLLLAPDGTLYAGAGPHGVLYKIAPDGACTALTTLPVNHLLSLAWRGQELVVTTAGEGGVYTVTQDGVARLLYGSTGEDFTTLAVDQAGNLYAGTFPSGQVIRVAPSGEAQMVYDNSDTPVNALLATRDGVYVGTAPDGQIFLIRDANGNTQRSASVLRESPAGFVSQMVLAPGGRAYALGNGPGGLLACALAAAREGIYTSTPLDAERLSTWGKLSWEAEAAAGAVLAQCRTGNSDDPEDGSWSAWSAPIANGSPLRASAGRFLQYRLRLQAPADQLTLVRRVKVSCLPANQAPQLEIGDPETGAALHNQVSISWDPTDPDDDALLTTVYLRPVGAAWEKLTGPTKEENYEWDTAALDAGRYDLRLVVNDLRSNPVGWLEAEALVTNLLVDNEAPALTVRLGTATEEQPPDVIGTVFDEGSGIVSIAWKNAEDDNGADASWSAAAVTVAPFSPALMSFTIPHAQVDEGVEIIVIRAIDAAGNYTDVAIDLVSGELVPVPDTTTTEAVG